tara:strand:+ start:2281 stop:2667 length:387 start_codon:yes stop_codon:yes gene_type:complete
MNNEEKLQSAIITYIKLTYPKARFCASLGGIYTGIKQSIKAVKTGYVKGFPDLQITEARGGYFGLFIEIKTNKGRATSYQTEWIKDLKERGYAAYICKGIDETIETIDSYMSQTKTKGLCHMRYENSK